MKKKLLTDSEMLRLRAKIESFNQNRLFWMENFAPMRAALLQLLNQKIFKKNNEMTESFRAFCSLIPKTFNGHSVRRMVNGRYGGSFLFIAISIDVSDKNGSVASYESSRYFGTLIDGNLIEVTPRDSLPQPEEMTEDKFFTLSRELEIVDDRRREIENQIEFFIRR